MNATRLRDQPPCRGRNANKGLSDGLERTDEEPKGFYEAVDREVEDRESFGRLLGREVYIIHRWGKTLDGDGYGPYTGNTGPHQGLGDGTLLVVFMDGTKVECKNEDE